MSDTRKIRMLNDGEVREYLLGRCTAEEEEEIECAILEDNCDINTIKIGEDELIEDYLRDELTFVDRALFEYRFLTTEERWERVHFFCCIAETPRC